METIGALLGLFGTLSLLVSFVSVLWPLKRLGLPTRKRSALAMLVSFWVIMIGAELLPDKPAQPSARDIDQAEPEPTPQPEAPADPSPPVEAAEVPQEPVAQPDQTPEPVAKRTSAPGPDRIDGDNNIGCRDRDFLGKLTRYANQGDREAFAQALLQAAVSSECVMFKADEPVFVTDTALFSGLVKVRRKGKLAEYWTNFEAVTR